MYIFFGRINVNQTPKDQYKKGYYHAKKGSSYFGQINEIKNFKTDSVYVFMIAEKTIELWKADRWSANEQNLHFVKTGIDLDNMNRAWFAAFKFFYLDSDLIVFTTRRPFKKAFFKLKFDSRLTEKMLLTASTYADIQNYRNIQLHNNKPTEISRDMIFYHEFDEWKFRAPDFFDNNMSNKFIDNTRNVGKGRPNKDSILRLISEAAPLPKTFNPEEISLLNVYDVFFCDYKGSVEGKITLKNEEFVFKISMSPKDIGDEAFEYLMEHNSIIVHKDTPGKATSHESQGDVFINKIKTGDYFYLCRGNQKFILIGRIISEAEVCELREYGSNGWVQRRFDLIKPCPFDEKYEGANKWWTPNNNSTCIQISDGEISLANTLIFAPYFNIVIEKLSLQALKSEKGESGKLINTSMSLNTIFFGPPGTGKTYQLLQLINDWKLIENNKQDLQYESFLQDLTWWQVVALVLIELKSATVPQILDHSLVKDKLSISSIQNKRSRIWSTLQNHTVDDCENVKYQNRHGIKLFYKDANSSWRLDNPDQAKSELEEVVAQMEEIHSRGKKTARRNYSFITCHQSLSYEDFIEGIKPVPKKDETGGEEERWLEYEVKKGVFYLACEKAAQLAGYSDLEECLIDDKKSRQQKFINAINIGNKYVVFLDEINRCNVSSVFGELITLIEDDKRLGAENEMTEVILPYSQTHFGVPGNLYIVGTMNTADRSVEALDTALRRRFCFAPKMPEESKLAPTTDGINLSKILQTINKRLRVLKDNDHTIGHAWLWNVTDLAGLKTIYGNKILPLLQEYFYNDYEKLGLVLGDAFFKKHKPIDSNIFASFSGGNGLASQYDQSWQFELKSAADLTMADFKSLENQINSTSADEDE